MIHAVGYALLALIAAPGGLTGLLILISMLWPTPKPASSRRERQPLRAGGGGLAGTPGQPGHCCLHRPDDLGPSVMGFESGGDAIHRRSTADAPPFHMALIEVEVEVVTSFKSVHRRYISDFGR